MLQRKKNVSLYYCGRPAIRWRASSCDSRSQWTTSRVLRREWILRRNNSVLRKYFRLTTDNIIPYNIYIGYICTMYIELKRQILYLRILRKEYQRYKYYVRLSWHPAVIGVSRSAERARIFPQNGFITKIIASDGKTL